MIPMEVYLMFGAILFVIGAYGVMVKKNVVVILMCIELMLNAANVNFITFAAYLGDAVGQAMVIMTISVAAAEVAVGIAIVLNAYKLRKTTSSDELTTMRW